jgi:hypothetical protein
MENRQRLANMPGRAIVVALAVITALVLVLSGIFYLATGHVATGSTEAASSVTVLHEQAPDAQERNAVLKARAVSPHEQAPDAIERNERNR